MLDKSGILQLLSDISKKLNLRLPSSHPGLDQLIERVNELLVTQRQRPAEIEAPVPKPQIFAGNRVAVRTIDPKVLQAYNELEERAKNAILKKLLSVSDKYALPKPEDLRKMDVAILCEVATAYNIPVPAMTNLRLLNAKLGLPASTDEEWKKINVMQGFRQANSELDRYETTT